MIFSKRYIFYFSLVLIVALFLANFKLPYYIYKPGRADNLESIVVVENGYESDGSMHLLTVSGSYATPLNYVIGKIMPFREVMPIRAIRDEDETDEEYMNRQLHMMEDSQHSSTIVAYEAAGADIEVISDGVYVVATVKNMPAHEVLENGDVIKKVDDIPVEVADDLVSYVAEKKAGEKITIQFERNNTEMEEEIEIVTFPDDDSRVGVGIQLTTNIYLDMEPEVNFSSGKIGGPSAGLMFALKIYDQLTEEDYTRGYKIAGTGKIDMDGNVLPVGGVDKKVVAADREGSHVFFVPYEKGRENSNYETALWAAKKIKTEMEIVPVDSFEEALLYLEGLEKRTD